MSFVFGKVSLIPLPDAPLVTDHPEELRHVANVLVGVNHQHRGRYWELLLHEPVLMEAM